MLSDLKLTGEKLMSYTNFKNIDESTYYTPANHQYIGSQKMLRKNRVRPKTPYTRDTSVKAKKSLKFD